MIFRRKSLVFIFILLLGLSNVNFKGTSNSIPVEPIGSRGIIIVNASGGGDYTHIQWAIDNASVGDMIHVKPGRYYENLVINKSINLIADGESNTIIDGDRRGIDIVEISSNWVNISGFIIKNSGEEKEGAWGWIYSGIKIINSKFCCIENNYLTKNGMGISISNSNNNLVINNIIKSYSNSVNVCSSYFNAIVRNNFTSTLNNCVYLYNSSSNRIINNNIQSDSSYGLTLSCSSSKNLITHNNFKNHINQLQAYDFTSNNMWNNSNKQGNFWADYTLKYPNAQNNSIVWDEPYAMDTYNDERSYDFFPSCNSFGEILTPIAIAGPNMLISQGQMVNFNGIRSYANFGIRNYTWKFTYNKTNILLYGPTPSFLFQNAGKYNIFLKVANFNGYEDIDKLIVNVIDIESPIPKAGEDVEIWQGDIYHFNGTQSVDNIGIINYTWTFTYKFNNISLFGPSPTFIFNVPGIYNISLNVTDADGNWAVEAMVLKVKDSIDPIARAGEDKNIQQNEVVILDGTNSNDNVGIINYTWNFTYHEVNIFLYGSVAYFVFEKAGIYFVKLKVLDSEKNVGFDLLTVFVYDITPPVANAGFNITICQGDTAFFNGSNSYDNVLVTNYSWSFILNNSIQFLFGPNSSYLFSDPGKYLVTLEIWDEQGLYDEDVVQVIVSDTCNPVANTGNDIIVYQNHIVFFNASNSSDNVRIVNYTWRFKYKGELVILHGPNPYFKFEIPGDYTVTLRVLDSHRNCAEDFLLITVNPIDNEKPHDDDDSDGGRGVRDVSTYIMAGIVLFAFIGSIIGIFIMYIRKQKRKDQAEEDEFGRTVHEDRPIVEEEDKDDDTQREKE